MANKRTESGPETVTFVTLKSRDCFCNYNFSRILDSNKKNHWVQVSANKLLEDYQVTSKCQAEILYKTCRSKTEKVNSIIELFCIFELA